MPLFKLRKKVDEPKAAASPAESIEVMRRRARHRLIGAVVLVLVGVVGFPLLFDTQPRPVAVDIPIVIPEIVMGIGILTLFSQIFGWVNATFSLSGDARWSMGIATVIISHIAFMVPFVTLVVQARLQGFDKSYEEAAMDLGANEWTTFRRVTLPMILPGVLSGALLAFTLSLDHFVITFFTNGPGSTTLPIYVYGLLRRIITPQVNALSTVWILVVLAAVLLLQILQSRESKQHS
jgi:spermidine/putrescine transport system permease protein